MIKKVLFRQKICILLLFLAGCDQDISTIKEENSDIKAINEALTLESLKAEETLSTLILINKFLNITASGELITSVREVNNLIEIQLEYGELLSISNELIISFEINENNWMVELTFSDSTTAALAYLGTGDAIEVLVEENPYPSSVLSANIIIKSPVDVKLNLTIEYLDSEDIYIETGLNDIHSLEIFNLRENYLNELKITGISEKGNERFVITKNIQTGQLPDFRAPLIERVYTNIASEVNFEKPVVFTGDSMIHRMNWNYVFRKISNVIDLPILLNRGIGGNRSTDLLRRFSDNVLNLNPSAVFIEIGTNDFVGLTSSNSKYKEDNILTNYKKILELGLNSNNDINIYIISIFPVLKFTDRNNAAQRVNDALEKYSLENDRLHFINSFDFFFDDNTNEAKGEYMIGPHTPHINDLGYEEWAKLIYPYILNTL